MDSNTADSHLPKSKQGRGGVASPPQQTAGAAYVLPRGGPTDNWTRKKKLELTKKLQKVIFYAGKTHDRPFRGVFRGGQDFFDLSSAGGLFRPPRKKNPKCQCFVGIQKITSQTFRISGILVILCFFATISLFFFLTMSSERDQCRKCAPNDLYLILSISGMIFCICTA